MEESNANVKDPILEREILNFEDQEEDAPGDDCRAFFAEAWLTIES